MPRGHGAGFLPFLLPQVRRSGTASRGPREPLSGYVFAALQGDLPSVEEVADLRGPTVRIRQGDIAVGSHKIDAVAPQADTIRQYGAGVGYRLGRTLRLGVDALYYRRSTVNGPANDYEGMRAGVSVVYGLPQ